MAQDFQPLTLIAYLWRNRLFSCILLGWGEGGHRVEMLGNSKAHPVRRVGHVPVLLSSTAVGAPPRP